MRKILSIVLLFLASGLLAQQPSFKIGGARPLPPFKDASTQCFRLGDVNYVLYNKFDMMSGTRYQLEGFKDPEDKNICSTELKVPQASGEIALFAGVGVVRDRMILFRSVLRKEEKKNVLYAHELSATGEVIDKNGKLVAEYPAEKAMNQGNYKLAFSDDRNSVAVLAEYPFVKETKEKIQVSVIDADLKSLWSKEFELSNDSRRGPVHEIRISNSGTVYIIKKVEGPKNADFHTSYVIADKGAKITEKLLPFQAPQKLIDNTFLIDERSSDLLICGHYTEDGKVSVGGTGYKGLYFFRLKADGSIEHKITPFEKEMTGLRPNQLLLVGNNPVFVSEERRENNISTEQKDSRGFPIYIREYNGENVHIHFLRPAGEPFKHEMLKRSIKSFDDNGARSAVRASVLGEQLMLVYNDHQYRHDGQEHKIVGPVLAAIIIPVIQFYDAEGNTGKKFPMMDTNVGGRDGSAALVPGISTGITQKEYFFMGIDNMNLYPIRLRLP